jgi:hypothetical protein
MPKDNATDGQNANERRQFPRLKVNATVRYAPRELADKVPVDLWEGATMNLSRTGAAVELAHSLHHGGAVEMFFMKSDPPRCISVVGRVVHSDRQPRDADTSRANSDNPCYLTGLEFTRLLNSDEIASFH